MQVKLLSVPVAASAYRFPSWSSPFPPSGSWFLWQTRAVLRLPCEVSLRGIGSCCLCSSLCWYRSKLLFGVDPWFPRSQWIAKGCLVSQLGFSTGAVTTRTHLDCWSHHHCLQRGSAVIDSNSIGSAKDSFRKNHLRHLMQRLQIQITHPLVLHLKTFAFSSRNFDGRFFPPYHRSNTTLSWKWDDHRINEWE